MDKVSLANNIKKYIENVNTIKVRMKRMWCHTWYLIKLSCLFKNKGVFYICSAENPGHSPGWKDEQWKFWKRFWVMYYCDDLSKTEFENKICSLHFWKYCLEILCMEKSVSSWSDQILWIIKLCNIFVLYLRGPARTCEDLRGPARTCEDLRGPARTCEDVRGPARTCKDVQGRARTCKDVQGRARNCKKLQETARNCKKLQETARNCKKLQETARNCKKLQ